jgi:small-conductance mechanosensitive channel
MAEYDEESAGRAAMWTYIWVMVGFKVVTAAFLLYYTHAFYTWAVLIALHIPWVVGIFVFGLLPGALYWRMVKVRARRAELLRQEFEVEPPHQELGEPVPV